jgi:hypothetical protein
MAAEYRAYVIGSDGHIVRSKPMICENDDEAITQAKAALPDHTIEIWCEGEDNTDRFAVNFRHR